jgi:transposase
MELKKDRSRIYTEGFKRSVIEEYLRTGLPKHYFLKKYNIRMRSGLQLWMKQLGFEDIHQKDRYLELINIPSLKAKKPGKDTPGTKSTLEFRIKELERLLEDEQLRCEAYKRVIDYAEKELKLPILKKPNIK